MSSSLSHDTLKCLFLQARSHAGWQDKPVSDDQPRELYDLAKWGPTSINCLPMRLGIFELAPSMVYKDVVLWDDLFTWIKI